MLRLLGHFLRAFAGVTLRRLRGRSRRPSWSFGFEVFVQGLRLHMQWIVSLPIPAMRRAADALRGRIAPGTRVREDRLAGVRVLWFHPPEARDGVLLYLHGGGHVLGSPAQDRGIASELARLAHVPVVSPDYRLAPDATYPADLEDALAVYDRLAQTEPGAIVLAGLSAGGGLALALLTRLRDEGRPMPARAVLLSPAVDATGTSPSWSSNADADWLAPEIGVRWSRMYAGTRDLTDPGVSPVNAKLEGLPPLLVIAGAAELLRDDAARLAERARAAGVDVTLHLEPDMVHAFMTFGRHDEATRRTFERMETFFAS